MSIYDDRVPATPEFIAVQIAKLSANFRKMDSTFFSVLTERIVANAMSAEQLNDAVANALDTRTYTTLTIADVISYDQRIKLYTSNDIVQAHGCYPHPDYCLIDTKFGERIAKVTDCEQYGIAIKRRFTDTQREEQVRATKERDDRASRCITYEEYLKSKTI